ncbi:nicotinic acid mononucleotide adenyltransferase [Flavobacterium agricola]|uniref:Nicotinic acid mononucleotide adenyltransferase n=1 Tax=Flavobacterium agricola TaxID=2870839 RepID=A0ABY6LXL1_9FLAO|nr:nicotinic acid mononucleotide adenyltransferase [Flavobacterium agricola]UYW01069.1 nicotinic acid mononucleotide adenyltransferase [Flavobacterium agricola]
MKKIFYVFTALVLFTLASCSSTDDYYADVDYSNILQSYDLWEIDHSRTYGAGAVPFLDKAITITFSRGTLFANNNFSGLGYVGNGFGIDVGYYKLGYNSVEVTHDLDGRYFLELISVNQNQIQLYDRNQRVTYVLNGYYKNDYNYEYVVYNNVGLLLQEFVAWRKISAEGGVPNLFDEENFLGFETFNNEFVSSNSPLNTPINYIDWNYGGFYYVSNTNNFKIKRLQLQFPDGNENFELTLINNGYDDSIYLYHLSSGTNYVFMGDGYIQFMRSQKDADSQPKQAKRVVSKRR